MIAWPAPPATNGPPLAATRVTEPAWAGRRSAAELDAEQPAVADPESTLGGDAERARFAVCGEGPRSTCVVDGDTFWYRGTKIRIADINTPEVSSPACPAEAALGAQATARLAELLNAGAFRLDPADRDEDRYGRKLRVVTRGGRSLGAELVNEGLAERWQGFRRDWC